jgi:hypothetical protein
MSVLDANALTADPGGMAFLGQVLGTTGDANAGRRFPIESWTSPDSAPASSGTQAGRLGEGTRGAERLMPEMA